MYMKTSEATRRKLKDFETGGKLVGNRLVILPKGTPALEAYPDDVGVWTIGWGHTGKVDGTPVARGMTITLDKCALIFDQDLATREMFLNDCLHDAPTNQNQFDALILIAFNIGNVGLANSTLMKLHKAGRFDKAAMQFARWNKGTVNGKRIELKGLTRRRAEEAALYATPVTNTVEAVRLSPEEPAVTLPVYDQQQSKSATPIAPAPASRSPTVIGAVAAGATAVPVTVQTVEMATDGVKQLKAESEDTGMLWLTAVFGVLVMLLSAYLIYRRITDAQKGIK